MDMNKALLAFGAGLAVGIGGTYLYLRQKYEDKLSEQIQEIREHYQKRKSPKKAKDDKSQDKSTRNVYPKTDSKSYTHYESICKKYNKDELVDPAEEESPPEDEPEEEIFAVGMDEIENYDDFETIDLTYYAGDDILCDDQEEVIEDPEAIIGDALTKFGEEGVPIFVINKNVKAIFEILMVEGSYEEIVLGMKEG